MSRRPGRRWSAEALDQAQRSPWWYSLADNPPCSDWCEIDHDPNDFRVGGAIHCELDLGHGVKVDQPHLADEDTPFLVESQPLRLLLRPAPEDLTPEDARALADALLLAAEFCEVHS